MDTISSSHLFGAQHYLKNADVYTDLNSLQQLKATEDKDLALRKVAQQFESMFLNMMMKSMRDANAVFEQDSMFNSGDVKFYRDMYDQQLTLSLAHSTNGGVGIANALYRQLSQSHGNTKTIQATPAQQASVPREREVEEKNTQAFAKSPTEFIDKVTPIMENAAEKLGVEANILVAQAALETGWGKYVLADSNGSSFNLFNIKANSNWTGRTVEVSALEFSKGTFKPEQSSFRAYDSIEQAVDDYVAFVSHNPRYQKALQSSADAGRYIRELHSAGYATDPDYADKVLSVRERLASASREG